MAKNKLSWQAPEYKHYEKNIGWYVTLVSVAVLIMGFFIITQQDYFAAITIGILTALIIFFSTQKPEVVEIHLTDSNLHHGNIQIHYKKIKHFWVVNHDEHRTVNFETASYLNKLVILELGDQDPQTVRDFLVQYLPEHEETDPTISQRATHWLKF